MLGAICFAFQIYGDFSGYSDIAIGTARLFGIRLMTNFKTPYFSRDIAEFWRRWHISLSTWFRDYLYIPLGGSRVGKWKAVRNTFVIFLVSGFWHGANWTFVVWGFVHAVLFLPLLLKGTNRRHTGDAFKDRWLPSLRDLWGMAWTFASVTVAWVFFRAQDLVRAVDYLKKGCVGWPEFTMVHRMALFWISAMLVFEWLIGIKAFKSWLFGRPGTSTAFRWAGYAIGCWMVVKHFQSQAEFIYFQF